MSQMLKSSGAMALATFASRILGMAREMVYAGFMGDSGVASAFKFAFMVPNLFRRLLGEGALTAAFIPIFKDKEKNAGEKEMWRAANAVISGLFVSAAIIIGVVLAIVSLVLAIGHLSENTELMLQLLRVMFPYMLLVCLTAVFMGILNARGHFFVPAMGAAVLNCVMIASVLLVAPRVGKTPETQIFAVAFGVLVAGVAQAAYQFPNLRSEGFRYQWVNPFGNDTVREVVRKMIPGMMGVAAFQLNVLLTGAIAFHIDDRIVASFDYAVRFMELPQGLFGISLATYLLPALSGLAAEKKYPEFRGMLRQAVSHLIFVNLLATILLVILAEPIIRLIFERHQFGADSTGRASVALMCLAPGLILFSLVNIMARAFYALGDTKTPMKISVFCLVLNLAFAAVLVPLYKQGGMGVANSLSAGFNAALLFYGFQRKMKKMEYAELRKIALALVTAAIAAGLAAWWLRSLWQARFGHADLLTRAGEVFVPMIGAALVYLGIALWLKVPSAREMTELALSRFRRGKD
jgi:putative peptidoglycan lipid II flippase